MTWLLTSFSIVQFLRNSASSFKFRNLLGITVINIVVPGLYDDLKVNFGDLTDLNFVNVRVQCELHCLSRPEYIKHC